MIFPRSLFPLGCGFLLAAAPGLRAQIPSPPPFTPPPAPPGAFMAPASLPINLPGLPNNPGAPGEENVRILFANSPIGDVLNFYSELTGKRILTDATVTATAPVNFEISRSVPRSEAVRIIETVLSLNGYSMTAGEGTIVKVLGPGKNPRSVSIPIFSDVADLPRGEQIVSYLMRLRYLDPIETAGVLQQYIPPGNSVNFTALEKAGALIVTDDANTVRKLADLVNSLDQPLAPVTEKWIRLERADAAKAIEFLNSVFDSKSSSTGGTPPGQPGASTTVNTSGGRRPIRRLDDSGQVTIDNPIAPTAPNLATGNGPITLSGDSIIQGRITLTADVRTNRVHVVTSPGEHAHRIEHLLLREYDADTPFACAGAPAVEASSARRTCCPSSCRRSAKPAQTTAATPRGPSNPSTGSTNPSQQREHQLYRRRVEQRIQRQQFGSNGFRRLSDQRQRQQQQHRGIQRAGHASRWTPTPTDRHRRQHQDHRRRSAVNTIILLGGAGGASDKVYARCSISSTCAPRRSSSAR